MTRPQESHADLGIVDDDRTPLLTTKAPDPQLAGTGSDANDHHPTKEQIPMSIAQNTDTVESTPTPLRDLPLLPTGTPAPFDAEKTVALMTLASERGITVSVQKTLRGNLYSVWSPDDEMLAWTYDFAEAHNAVHNYWPASTVVGSVEVGRETVRVDLSPAFGGDPERVYIEGSMYDGMTVDEAAGLAAVLLDAVTAARAIPQARPA